VRDFVAERVAGPSGKARSFVSRGSPQRENREPGEGSGRPPSLNPSLGIPALGIRRETPSVEAESRMVVDPPILPSLGRVAIRNVARIRRKPPVGGEQAPRARRSGGGRYRTRRRDQSDGGRGEVGGVTGVDDTQFERLASGRERSPTRVGRRGVEDGACRACDDCGGRAKAPAASQGGAGTRQTTR
jgi:hypothetical protein